MRACKRRNAILLRHAPCTLQSSAGMSAARWSLQTRNALTAYLCRLATVVTHFLRPCKSTRMMHNATSDTCICCFDHAFIECLSTSSSKVYACLHRMLEHVLTECTRRQPQEEVPHPNSRPPRPPSNLLIRHRHLLGRPRRSFRLVPGKRAMQ